MPKHNAPRVGDLVDYWAYGGKYKITNVGAALPNGRIKVTLEHDAEFDPDEGDAYGAPSNPPTGGGG